ncbi:MAG: hypothetical protein P1U64_11785 [Alcanivoracaceae bacterium]|nr:hypothetical protein [Alcanivoracaceae bacterium]
MTVQRIQLKSDKPLCYSPFTGQCTENATSDGLNVGDPSLIFAFYGDAGEYDTALGDRMLVANIDPEATPDEITTGVDVIISVDAGLSGYCVFGFKAVDPFRS